MEYPVVKKAHIVPRAFLSNFAIDDQLSVQVVPQEETHTVSIDDAAVRRAFYRRTRPDGTPIDDVEWSLSQLEGSIAPLLQAVEGSWPLEPLRTKANLAEFLAFQAVRGPRWRTWHEHYVRKAVEERRREGAHQLESGIWVPLTQRVVDDFETHLLSDTQRLVRMMSVANKLIHVFGSMTWDLVKFDEPLLALSDHPVVEWPLNAGRRMPEIATKHGAINVLEIRVPLAPDLALLMSWQDRADASSVLQGTPEIAANFNAFTIAQAERQWMHQPGSSPSTVPGPFEPVSLLLCPGYERGQAERSAVRLKVQEILNSRLGEDSTGEAQIVTAA